MNSHALGRSGDREVKAQTIALPCRLLPVEHGDVFGLLALRVGDFEG